jgi:hypothetical protein
MSLKRKHQRKRVRLTAWIDLGDRICIGHCKIADISEGGAKLRFDEGDHVPTRFVLRLTQDGSIGRICERMWTTGSEAGVKFVGRVHGHSADLGSFPAMFSANQMIAAE